MQNASLNSRADGDNFIRIDAFVRLLAEELFDDFLNFRHTRHAANQHHFADFSSGQTGVLQCLFTRLHSSLDQIVNERFKFCARQLERQMFWPRAVGCDVGQIDICLSRRRQLDLGFLRSFF